jgi:iron complex outermembrane receptor protein
MSSAKPMNRRILWAAFASVICAAGASLPSNVARAEDATAASGDTLAEVIVTAEKRAENVVKTFVDVSGILPNASLEREGLSVFASSFYIRGMGTQNRGPFVDPAVSVSVDGVLGGYVSTAITDMVDVAGIEVLRGPQGTLQGRNSTGGAIIVRHADPDPKSTNGDIGLLAGNYGRYEVKGMGNFPFADGHAAFRIAGKYSKFDGFFNNIYDPNNLATGGPGKRVGGEKRLVLLPSVRWEADTWDLTLRGTYNSYRDDSSVLIPLYNCAQDPRLFPASALNDTYLRSVALRYGGAAALQYCAHSPSSRDYTINQNRPIEGANLDTRGITTEFNRRFEGAGTLTFVGNYQTNQELSALDVDGTFQQLNSNQEFTKHQQYSGELRFASETSKRIDYVAGMFYLKQHYDLDRVTSADGASTSVPQGPAQTISLGGSKQNNTQSGVFAQFNWHFTPALTGVLGARYTNDKKDIAVCGALPTPANADCSVRLQLPANIGSASWSDTTPRVGLNFKVNDNAFLYAYWAKGFRAGGFNGEAGSALLAGPFNPESVKTTEVGAKIDGWDNKLRMNFALFDSKASELQRQVALLNPSNPTVVSIFTLNAAGSTIRGAEAEFTLLPVKGLTLGLSLGYLDAKYTDYCQDLNGSAANDPSLVNCAPPTLSSSSAVVAQKVDLTGLPLARSPKFTARFGAVYTMGLANGSSLSYSGEIAHQGKELMLDSGIPVGTTLGLTNFDGSRLDPVRPATNIVNASVSWKSSDSKLRVSVYGKNLTNEVYFRRLSFAAPTLSFGTVNDPREYGIEANYKLSN